MLSSFAKNLLIYLVFLLYLSGCGAPPNSDDKSDASVSSGTSGSTSIKPPSVTVVTENGNINLDWNDIDAAQYRVLYWQGNDAPQEFMTASTAYTLPPLSTGYYTVIVEAYDELGNSLFSAPVALEVL